MPATSLASANRKVDIINQTSQPIRYFYASTPDINNWEEDILGRDHIAVGETFEIDVDDGTGACVFDFKAVFLDGTSKGGVTATTEQPFTIAAVTSR